ncbi:acyltransferase family protein [Flavihumibacter fluvii]|uniref:acyltransferase family protein n=1 Tax=Flavihumibacter fluvii TaxID=2838157 RepID=UPI001BDF39A1|nr:acyltransferase [Flavihumibacter fluvii]ULQ52393.1 acyltransferase [Flavihumibacter fluvii]
MNNQGAAKSAYYPQLDFLRFVAVTLVILEHWFGSALSRNFEFGYLGVLLFFVLSGFLISGILLKNRAMIDAGMVSKRETLKVFYIRRTLRIFPVYYFLLLFLFIFSFEGIRQKALWYFLYASNIYTYIQQEWDGMIGPFWSLAVEEQFYLVWPLLMLVMPVRKMPAFFGTCLLLAPVFRLLSIVFANHFSEAPLDTLSMRVLMPSCIDSFAAGGLLAFWRQDENTGSKWLKYLNNKYLVSGLVVIAYILLRYKENFLFYLLFPSVFSFLSVTMIAALLVKAKGLKGVIFNNPFLLHLGKISYGLYLFHGPFPLIFSIVDVVLGKLHKGFTIYHILAGLPKTTRSLVWVVYLVGLASLSYYILEKPFNKLKDKFLYK